MEETKVDSHWHLRKELNVTHIFMTLTLAGSIVLWGMQMDRRLTATEVRLDAMQEAVIVERQYQRQAHAELVTEIRAMRAEVSELNRRLSNQEGPRR